MSLFRPKNIKNWLKKQASKVPNMLILAIFLASTIRPAAVEAENGNFNTFLSYFSQNSTIDNNENKLVIKEAPGIKPKTARSIGKSKPDNVVRAVITAYTSTVDQTDDDPFIAASGRHVYDGMVAANWLPFGTKIKIPSLYGDKEFIVDDRMNERYGYGRMDIWLNSNKQTAIKFGVKVVDIEIYYQSRIVQLSMVVN